MYNPEPTLRERRRERTWNAIHQASVDLVRQKGLKKTTTDEIAEIAGISPRTFFNYFATKEDAVLGLREPVVSAEILEADKARQDFYIFERVVHLLLDVVLQAIPESKYKKYRELAEEYPELRHRLKVLMLKSEQVVEEFLRTIDWATFARAGRRGEFSFVPEGSEPQGANWSLQRASVMIASSVLRYMDFSAGLPEGEVRNELIRDSVRIFQQLLRED